MSDWFAQLGYKGQLATWVMASFLLYTLASQLAWQYRYPERDDVLGRLVDRLRDQPFMPWAEQTVRLVYYLGIPFLAAINGLVGADLLGISGTDWVEGQSVQGFLWEDWARGVGLATAGSIALGGLWSLGRWLSRRAGIRPAASYVLTPRWQQLMDVLYYQIHWAFYRSGPILWTGDLYWGVFAGLALILVERMLNPAFWWSVQDPETAGEPLIQLGFAGLSTLLFFATQNLWLSIAAHAALTLLLTQKVQVLYDEESLL
jgi:hypothetical protein